MSGVTSQTGSSSSGNGMQSAELSKRRTKEARESSNASSSSSTRITGTISGCAFLASPLLEKLYMAQSKASGESSWLSITNISAHPCVLCCFGCPAFCCQQCHHGLFCLRTQSKNHTVVGTMAEAQCLTCCPICSKWSTAAVWISVLSGL